MRSFSSKSLAPLLLIAVLWRTDLSAQTAISGGLTGIITDQSGAVLPNANIEIKDKSKGAAQSTKSDREGVYRFFFLTPGGYTVTVAIPGFAATSRTVSVSLGQTVSVDFTLKIASANTTVPVTTDAPTLQTESADVSTVFNASQIGNLPNPGNDLTNVAQTAPGAVMNTQKTSMGGSGNFSTYGLPATSNLFTLDGMDENDPVGNVNVAGATGLMLGLNEVQEATVVNNGFSAQYGRFAGGFSRLSLAKRSDDRSRYAPRRRGELGRRDQQQRPGRWHIIRCEQRHASVHLARRGDDRSQRAHSG